MTQNNHLTSVKSKSSPIHTVSYQNNMSHLRRLLPSNPFTLCKIFLAQWNLIWSCIAILEWVVFLQIIVKHKNTFELNAGLKSKQFLKIPIVESNTCSLNVQTKEVHRWISQSKQNWVERETLGNKILIYYDEVSVSQIY